MMEANVEEPLEQEMLARYVGLSRRQLERLFRKHLGRTPAQYYLELRLERARHLLYQTHHAGHERGVRHGLRLRLALLDLLPPALRQDPARRAGGDRLGDGAAVDRRGTGFACARSTTRLQHFGRADREEPAMDLDEPPLLHEPDLMLAVLRIAAAGSGTLDDCLEHLRQLRRYAQVAEPMPEDEVRAQLETVQVKLRLAGLIEVGASGRSGSPRLGARSSRTIWVASTRRC